MTGYYTIDAIRLLFAAYFLVLSVAAVFGKHRWLMTYPFQVFYSLIRVIVLTLTFGRVRMTPVIERATSKPVSKVKKVNRRFKSRKDTIVAEIDAEDGVTWGSSKTMNESSTSFEPDNDPFSALSNDDDDDPELPEF